MKKLLLLTLLICIFVSCTTELKKSDEYWDSQTMFIIKSIRKGRGMEKFVIYTVEVVDANGISTVNVNSSANLKFEFSDTINKYKVGQAVHFTKY
jgi:hypothetical protein